MKLRNFFKKKQIEDIAKKEQAFYQKNTQKKFLKIFAAASLALITSATTLLATTPFGTSAASAAAAESETQPTAQENLAAGSLNLNPETDPTIYTTESGLEIKFGGATLESGALIGYNYFTMGTYVDVITNTSYPVNWVIIGKSQTGFDQNSKTLATYFSKLGGNSAINSLFNQLFNINDLAAGQTVLNDSFRDVIFDTNSLTFASKEISTAELNSGEVLCLSECVLYNTPFNATRVNTYSTSTLKTELDEMYDTTLNLTQGQKELFVPQTLTSKANVTSTVYNVKFFLLAGSGEKFNCSSYLKSNALRIGTSLTTGAAAAWWLRSGNDGGGQLSGGPTATGAIEITWWYSDTASGVRPAFVMKLA